MLKYYTSELIIRELEDEDTIKRIYESYEDFNLEIPRWYNKTR